MRADRISYKSALEILQKEASKQAKGPQKRPLQGGKGGAPKKSKTPVSDNDDDFFE